MKLPALITSDLHFTANPRDEYRWALWPWLRKTCEKEGAHTLLILGDLTDAKDHHPAKLVNRIMREIEATRACVERIIILQGNHDYEATGHPYFAFLSALPGVTFAARPLDTSAEGEAALFLPHTKTPLKDWSSFDWSMYRYVFMHQTVDGSIASNGQRMAGDQFPDMRGAGKLYSGDIHVPQVVAGVEYVGSPYHVHFGDRFKPRCVLIDAFNKAHDLRFRTIQRVTLDALPGEFYAEGYPSLKASLYPGDQCKLRIHLQAAELGDWKAIKRAATEALAALRVECFGIEMIAPKHERRIAEERGAQLARHPEDAVAEFADAEGLSAEALDAGLGLL